MEESELISNTTNNKKKMESIPIGIKIKFKKNRELIWNTTNYNQNLNT